MSNLSLIQLMRDDPNFGRRFDKKVTEIKEEKKQLLNTAARYEDKYNKEVLAGTQLRAKLLTEGAAQGKTEQEIMSEFGRFVPTVYTPILNMLYFILRENEDENPKYYKNLYAQRDRINEELKKQGMLDHKDDDNLLKDENISELLDELTRKAYEETSTNQERKEVNNLMKDEDNYWPKDEDVNLKETPEMVEYLYGNISLDMFNKIKKLKHLAQSPNIQEATLAFKKCRELCAEYNLEYDKIPLHVDKRK
jgi:soluble cytochrome b562